MVDMPWCLSKNSVDSKDLKGVLSQAFHLELSWDVLSPSATPVILSVNGQTLTNGVLRGDPCGQKRRYSLKQCKAFSLEAAKKGELLFIEGRDSNWAQHNCLLGFGGSFYFCPFSSSSMEGHMLLLLSVQDAFGVNDNLWRQTLAFQTWTKVSDVAGSNSHTSNHSLICEALE